MIPLYLQTLRTNTQMFLDRFFFWIISNPREFFLSVAVFGIFSFMGFAAILKTSYEDQITKLNVQLTATQEQYRRAHDSLGIAKQTLAINNDINQHFAELYSPERYSYYPIVAKHTSQQNQPRLGVAYQVPDAVNAALYNQILASHNTLSAKLTNCNLPVPPAYAEYNQAGRSMRRTLYIIYTSALLETIDNCLPPKK